MILTNASICADDQHSKIWTVAGEAKDGGLQVLVVTRKINECDHFGGTLANLLRCPRLAVIHNLGKDDTIVVSVMILILPYKEKRCSKNCIFFSYLSKSTIQARYYLLLLACALV